MMRVVLICTLAFSANALVASDNDDLRRQAIDVLRSTARKSQSTLLAQVSVRAGTMGLDKVRSMLSSTLATIKKEHAEAEAEHNKCENDKAAAQDAVDDANVAQQAAAAKESKARGDGEAQKKAKKAAAQRLKEIASETASKEEARNDDKTSLHEQEKDLTGTIDTMQGALDSISEDSPLRKIVEDMKNEKEELLKNAREDSAAMQKSIAKQLQEFEVEKAAQTVAQQQAEQNLGLVEDQISEYAEDHELQKKAFDQAKSNQENVLAACTVKPKSHAQKVQELADEIDGLHNALEILAPQ